MPTDFGRNDHEHHPQQVPAVHPTGLKEIIEHDEEHDRKHEPGSSWVAIGHMPRGMQGCENERNEGGKSNEPSLNHEI
jgi:hypothetical protein